MSAYSIDGRNLQTAPERFAVVVPVGPGGDLALDTLDSIECYCPEPHVVVLVDDCTRDGTYESLCANRRPNWHILRNERPMRYWRLVHTLCSAFKFILSQTECTLAMKMDVDALMIGPGILTDAIEYANLNPSVGLFGVYAHDYNRPRRFDMHERQITKEMSWARKLLGLSPSWANLLVKAEMRGYRRGDNVFGGACFYSRKCLTGMSEIGALDVQFRWNSKLLDDIYFPMAVVAAGFDLGHFGAPEDPLCLEYRGLPYPASELLASGYKVIHSVDKGKNTDRAANGGKTAREAFRGVRESSKQRTIPVS